MARGPNKKAEEAHRLYKQGMKLVEIASQLNVPDGTVRRWKNTYKWDENNANKESERSDKKANVRKQNKGSSKEPIAQEVGEVLKNTELTERQRLFCIYFVRCFNASKAYKKAYKCDEYVARINGSRMLTNANIKKEIDRLKQQKFAQAYLSEEDIFQKYMDIAFADIGDYLQFGPAGVILNNSSDVDTSIIAEVAEGKNGIKLKLADRMKALNWIAEHMDMATEEQKAKVQFLNAQCKRLEEKDPADPKQNELLSNMTEILKQIQPLKEEDILE